MAELKVHGVPYSPATMRVLVALHEKGLEYNFNLVDLRSGEHKKEPHLRLNPFGQVPAFEDGDLQMFESRAITQYIAEEFNKKGTKLLNSSCCKTKAITLVWMAVEAHQFDPAAMKLTFEQVFKPMLGMTTDPAAVEENEAKLDKVLDVYEEHLSDNKYMAGNDYSLADLHHLPVIHYLMGTPTKRVFDKHPRVSAWIANISARPAWTKVLDMQKP